MDTPETETPAAYCQHYGFLLVDDFTLIGFASALEPLRMANLAGGRRRYRWTTVTCNGQPVKSSSGVPIQPDCAMDDIPTLDALFVCGSNPIPARIAAECLDWQRLLARQGTDIGGNSIARAHV